MPPKKDSGIRMRHNYQEVAGHLTDFSYEPPGVEAEQFAAEIGVSKATLQKWISGDVLKGAHGAMNAADLNALSLKGTEYSENRKERIKGHLDKIRHMGSKHSLKDYAKEKGLSPDKVRSWAEDDAYAELREAVSGRREGDRLRRHPYQPAPDPYQSLHSAEVQAASSMTARALGTRAKTDRWLAMARDTSTAAAGNAARSVGNTGNPLGDAPAGTLPANRERSSSPPPAGAAPSPYRQRAENSNPQQRKAPRPS